MSAFEDLLREHIRGSREQIAKAISRVDALEALIGRLNTQAAAQPVPRPRDDGWSDEEDAIIREYYPSVGAPGCAKLLPHRTAMAIRSHAARKLKVNRLSGPGVNAAKRAATWCDQCEHRVSSYQIATCKSQFCKAKVAA